MSYDDLFAQIHDKWQEVGAPRRGWSWLLSPDVLFHIGRTSVDWWEDGDEPPPVVPLRLLGLPVDASASKPGTMQLIKETT